MSIPGDWPQVLDFFGTPLVIEPSRGQLSGDAGLLPIHEFDERSGLTRGFTAALDDPRDPDLTELGRDEARPAQHPVRAEPDVERVEGPHPIEERHAGPPADSAWWSRADTRTAQTLRARCQTGRATRPGQSPPGGRS